MEKKFLLQKRDGQKPKVMTYTAVLANRKDMREISQDEANKYLELDKSGRLLRDPKPVPEDDTIRPYAEDGIEIVDTTRISKSPKLGKVIMDEELSDEEVEMNLNPDIAAEIFSQRDRDRTFDEDGEIKEDEVADESPHIPSPNEKMQSEIEMVEALNLKNQLELYALNTVGLEIKHSTVKQMRDEIIEAIKQKHKE